MATIINRTKEMREQSVRENGAQRMNSQAHRAEANRINQKVKKVRRDFQIKDSRSALSASRVILTS
jgi:thioredoxin reductase